MNGAHITQKAWEIWNLHDQIMRAQRAVEQVKQSGMHVYPRTALYVWKLEWLRYGEDLRRAQVTATVKIFKRNKEVNYG